MNTRSRIVLGKEIVEQEGGMYRVIKGGDLVPDELFGTKVQLNYVPSRDSKIITPTTGAPIWGYWGEEHVTLNQAGFERVKDIHALDEGVGGASEGES